MNCASIKIEGRVQGVWFRDYIRKEAIKLNLCGWVKNNVDGSVSTEIEGQRPVIKALIEKIKIGTPLSKVENVMIDWLEFENRYQTFKIIR